MDLILINPKNFDNGYTAEPLGIMYLSSTLVQNKHIHKCIDLNFEEDYNTFKQILDNAETNIFVISCYTDNRHQVFSLAKQIRASNPKATIILGGHHPTFLPEEMLKNYDIDIIIRGEGELSILELMKVLKEKKSGEMHNIEGISYKKGKEIFHNKDRNLIEDISLLPWPVRLNDFTKRYKFYRQYFGLYSFNIKLENLKAAGIITSRGCSYSCTYCSIQKFWKRKTRYRDIEDVIGEIKYLISDFEVNFVFIWDDIFTLNRKRVIEFCEQLQANNIKINWGCITRVDLVDKELLSLMKTTGCNLISYGVESGNEKILSKISKRISKEQIIDTVQMTKNLEIDTRISLLVGSPSETDETIAETENLLEILKPNGWSVNILRIYPKTDICEELIAEGLFSNEYWHKERGVPY